MNIKDKARERTLFLHCAGPKVQDIFDTLEDTGEEFETSPEKLMEYFKPRKQHQKKKHHQMIYSYKLKLYN